ncbi:MULTISPECIES: phage tail protein [Photorhabdus]|nr:MULTISPECIES: phage tail protein [Photorhabdus]
MSSYNAGTVSIANSDILIGTGTNWKDNKFGVAPSQTILIKVGYDFKLSAIKYVNSDTELVLIDNFPYSVSNAEYFIQTSVPNTYSDAARKITAQLRYTDELLFNLNEWMTESGVVYITTPEGKTIQLKSINALTSKIAELQKNSVSLDYVDDNFARGKVGHVYIKSNFPALHFFPPDGNSRGIFVIQANFSVDDQPLEIYKQDDTNYGIIYSVTFPTKSGKLATLDDIDAANNIPVGVPLPYPHRYTPAGYLTCNGQTFDKSRYPKLALAYPDGRVPDLRGEFIRGWDDSRGVDPGRVCGTWQEGSYLLQEIANPPDNIVSFSVNERTKLQWDTPQNKDIPLRARASGGSATTWTTNAAYIGVSRPRNIAFNYIVRAV